MMFYVNYTCISEEVINNLCDYRNPEEQLGMELVDRKRRTVLVGKQGWQSTEGRGLFVGEQL